MLHITADLYSGRPNPSWLVAEDAEIRPLLRELGRCRASAGAESAAADAGALGELRGFRVEVRSDDLALDHGLPSSLYVPLGSADEGSAPGAAHELAERLLGLATPERAQAARAAAGAEAAGAKASAPPRRRSRRSTPRCCAACSTAGSDAPAASPSATPPRRPRQPPAPPAEARAEPEAAQAAATCMVEYGAYNPAFWNGSAQVLQNNNCYNYASNKRTDTFAQPGRGSGRIYTAITCPAVSDASLRDGLHRRYACFPDSEKPRYLVALVVAPGPGFVDFHWYRRNSEGFWSHKPGSTAVRNVDNGGKVITNPETCNRGPYTQFCGYFYTCRSQRIR